MKHAIELFTLPRGGTLALCDGKPIQFGVPPETIKDTMSRPCGVPDVFVLSEPLFSLERGISCAELEFPVYYNFFVKKRKVTVVCTASQRRRVLAVLQESLFGPKRLHLAMDFAGGKSHWAFPEMRAEMDYFRRNPAKGRKLNIRDFVRFRIVSHDNPIDLGRARVRIDQRGRFLVSSGKEAILIEPNLIVRPRERETAKQERPFTPPLFGVTTLGSGHGFDPDARTSGFILWINRKGIMVDPPVDATEWLRNQQINPKLINAVILTHCHADHDAGTLQKVLEEGRVELYTTKTVLDSFLRKATALTGLKHDQLLELVDQKPVIIGTPVRINGGEFRFRYMLHSIPTVGFEVFFHGKSFIYSADTLNDPEAIKKLYRERVLTPGRRDELLNFPWHHSVIFHEAGIPPLHTPVDVLVNLPDSVKKRLYVVHVAGASIPKGSGLKVAKPNLDKTIRIRTGQGPHSRAIQMLNILCNIELFRDFPIDRASQFLAISHSEQFQEGEVIIRKETEGDAFYIIVSGQAAVVKPDGTEVIYGPGDYFGETALVLEMPRTTDVVAKTPLTTISINKYDFLYFIRGTHILTTLRRLYINRSLESWELMDEAPQLRELTPTQRTQLQAIMDTDYVQKGQYLLREGKAGRQCYLIANGDAAMIRKGIRIRKLGRGDFCGDVRTIVENGRMDYSVKAESDLHLFMVDGTDLIRFLEHNPGVYLRLAGSFENE